MGKFYPRIPYKILRKTAGKIARSSFRIGGSSGRFL